MVVNFVYTVRNLLKGLNKMPQNLNYENIFPYISNSRISAYQGVFAHEDSMELYGIYMWSQQAAASLYPIFQNIEVTLRNALDHETRAKFGDFWWDIKLHSDSKNKNKFLSCIKKAKSKLDSEWCSSIGFTKKNLPSGMTIPTWSHDQIIASTDFSTWEYILMDVFDFSTTNNTNCLWPSLLGKVFKNYDHLSSDPKAARKKILDLIREIRLYRNRLFHHEPIWVKAPNVTNAKTAIDTVRRKINKIEKMISIVDNENHQALLTVGVFLHARRVCSTQNLSVYMYNNDETWVSKKQKKVIKKILSDITRTNTLSTFEYEGETFALQKIR